MDRESQNIVDQEMFTFVFYASIITSRWRQGVNDIKNSFDQMNAPWPTPTSQTISYRECSRQIQDPQEL